MSSQQEADFNNLVIAAADHLRAGRADDAEAAYEAALALHPGHPALLHNLGVLAARAGRQERAITRFDEALAIEPLYAAAHYNRAVALAAVGKRLDAIQALNRVVELEPEHYQAHRALGFFWLAEGDRGRALDHFARTYDLRRGDDQTGLALKSLITTNRTKLMHDAAQFDYLAGLGRNPKRYQALARSYQALAENFSVDTAPLSEDDFEIIGEKYNEPISISFAPEIAGGAVAPRSDSASLADAVRKKGAVWFDGLLTPAALRQLRDYMLESTVWHDFSHIGGLVASYLEDGLASPLLLQIADEIRSAFPGLLNDLPLTQAWAFKGVAEDALIDVHVDDAACSINFWITPDEANLDPGHGGMAVCLEPPPADWQVTGYDADKERAVHFLEQHRQKMLVIPYRANRAVLFKSRLLHVSDQPRFAQGYENSRINVTLLFGESGNPLSLKPF